MPGFLNTKVKIETLVKHDKKLSNILQQVGGGDQGLPLLSDAYEFSDERLTERENETTDNSNLTSIFNFFKVVFNIVYFRSSLCTFYSLFRLYAPVFKNFANLEICIIYIHFIFSSNGYIYPFSQTLQFENTY